jgi:hypothetical protein
MILPGEENLRDYDEIILFYLVNIKQVVKILALPYAWVC